MKDAESPNSTITVVVTAVGAIIGQGIVASLRKSGRSLHIIGVDRDPDGMGRYFCDKFIPKPPYDENDTGYVKFWQCLAKNERVDLVFPGLESDVIFFNRNRDMFNDTKTKVALNESNLIELAQDKWDMGEAMHRHGLPAIPSTLERDFSACRKILGEPPLFLKPRRGNGSRGISIIRNEIDFHYFTQKCDDDFLIQRFIGSDDREYTVGLFGFGDGTGLPPIIFRRKLSPAGNTQYAEVVDEPFIAKAARDITEIFRPLGPTNFQFRIEEGFPFLLEINPRFSSSTSLRAAFGYNEALMALDFYMDGIKPSVPSIRKGRGWRYSEDIVIT